MKKGKWNYTEDIEFTVIQVKILKTPTMPMHWQNAFIGEHRQAVRIDHGNHRFWIDNQDGSGLHKIAVGGGPGSYSAHLAEFHFIRELPESEWQQWDPILHRKHREAVDAWQKANFPEEFERMQELRKIISGGYKVDRNGTIQSK